MNSDSLSPISLRTIFPKFPVTAGRDYFSTATSSLLIGDFTFFHVGTMPRRASHLLHTGQSPLLIFLMWETLNYLDRSVSPPKGNLLLVLWSPSAPPSICSEDSLGLHRPLTFFFPYLVFSIVSCPSCYPRLALVVDSSIAPKIFPPLKISTCFPMCLVRCSFPSIKGQSRLHARFFLSRFCCLPPSMHRVMPSPLGAPPVMSQELS